MSGAAEHRRTLAWWQLLRAGNVFTAISNVIAGFLIIEGAWTPVGPLLALIAASALLYEAGMVLNDAFDAELDAVERPERPIPSGRISRTAALTVGWSLLAGGVICAAVASWLAAAIGPIIVATCLAVMVVMYDGGLKRTWAGPLAMGWCRTLNVLLGGSLVHSAYGWFTLGLYAAAVGVYTVGLTLLAAREAGEPRARRSQLIEGVVALACGLLFAWPWALVNERASNVAAGQATVGFIALMLLVGITVSRAKQSSDPLVVRRAVKKLIVGFILIDACAATAAAGLPSGLAVLALVAPTLLAARWAPMT
jgi:4-hydroxybenzoate polyprenyltransferase